MIYHRPLLRARTRSCVFELEREQGTLADLSALQILGAFADGILRQFIQVRSVPSAIRSRDQIRVGDYFENCEMQPCFCAAVSDAEPCLITGVSLVTGERSYCILGSCEVRLLTPAEAAEMALRGPPEDPS